MGTRWANPRTLREGQQGTVFRATITDDADDTAVDVSGASVKQIKAKKPDGTTVEKAAAFTSDGTDGQIEFSDDSAELTDQTGTWKYWGRVELPGGFQGDSDTLRYVVEAVGS